MNLELSTKAALLHFTFAFPLLSTHVCTHIITSTARRMMSFGDMVANDFQKLPKLPLGELGDKEAAAHGAASARRCVFAMLTKPLCC